MKYEVVVTAAAKQNLRAAYLWAAERAPLTAAAWLNRFEAEMRPWRPFPNAVRSLLKTHSLPKKFAN